MEGDLSGPMFGAMQMVPCLGPCNGPMLGANDFAFIPTLTFDMLFKNDFLIVLALFPFAEPPRL